MTAPILPSISVKRPSFLEKKGPAMSSNSHRRPLRRLSFALAAAGLLAASLFVVDLSLIHI